MMRLTCYYLPLIFTVIINYGCAVNPATGEQDLVLMTEQQEIALGRETNQQVLQQYGKYDDPKLQNYVQKNRGTLSGK